MRQTPGGWLLLLLLVGGGATVHAHDGETHRQLSRRAVATDVSTVDQVLKEELGQGDGIDAKFVTRSVARPRSVTELVGDGAFAEDDPDPRSLNHFHNPLAASWAEAGLRQVGQSSVLWQQNPAQGNSSGGGSWAWPDARRHYLNALTRPAPGNGSSEDGRDQAFADLFEALGHLVHLVQDASVPAHVRDDPHPTIPVGGWKLRIRPDWYETHVEAISQDDQPLFQALLRGEGDRRPPDSIFTATGVAEAPAPVARLIDGDRFDGASAQALSAPDLGIAEYTNGNFLSRGTLFRRFPFPRVQSLDLGNPALVAVGARYRRYYRKTGEGEHVERFVTEGALHRDLTAALGTPPPAGGWNLDRPVSQDYAAKLLPRAVGYSAKLLDYFFRGRLDLKDVADESGTVTLSGTNGSAEELVDGTLALYADDVNGLRSPLPGVAPVSLTGVKPGDPFALPPFAAPAGTERLVAVYTGTLGQEARAGGSPGAVIGKVLGGVRVEQVFLPGGGITSSTRWQVRTPLGVHALPVTYGDVSDLRWGDAGNTLVGIRYLGERPSKVVAYQIARPAGAPTIPLRTEPDGSQVVDLLPPREVDFPLEEDLGTTLSLAHTIRFAEHLPYAMAEVALTWDGHGYVPAWQAVSGAGIVTTGATSQSFARSVPVRLAADVAGLPYDWWVQQVGLTATGQIVALVGVSLGPTEARAEFPRHELVLSGGGVDAVPMAPAPVAFEFGPWANDPIMWALIDVDARQVIGSTAPRTPGVLGLAHETAAGNLPAIRQFTTRHFVGGPLDGLVDVQPVDVGGVACSRSDFERMAVLAEADGLESGTVSALTTQYAPEIAPFGFATPVVRDTGTILQPLACRDPNLGTLGFRYTVESGRFRPDRLEQVVRVAPVSGQEQLVAVMAYQALDDTDAVHGRVLRLNPGTGAAEQRVELPPALAGHWLSTANGRSALMVSVNTDHGHVSTILSLQAEPATARFPSPLWTFALVDPDHLYEMNDLKFYRWRPALERTAFPAALATAPDFVPFPAVGVFHALPLK